MNTSKSGKANPMVFVIVIIFASMGFMATAFYSTQKDFASIRSEIKDMKSKVETDVSSLNDQMNKRYLTLLKMSEGLSDQEKKLGGVERTIMSEREQLAKFQENFRAELTQVKKMGGDASKLASDLEEQFKREVKVKEVKLARLQDDYDTIKNTVDDQSALLVTIREQTLLNGAYKKPEPGTTTVPINPPSLTPTPTMMPSMTPGDSSTVGIPQNNRVVTDLPTNDTSPAPVTPAK